jgi:hypothetical protein
MTNVDILVYLAIFFTVVVGSLAAGVLYRAFKILGYAERIMSYVDHVRGMLLHWETLPLRFLDHVLDAVMGGGKKKKR